MNNDDLLIVQIKEIVMRWLRYVIELFIGVVVVFYLATVNKVIKLDVAINIIGYSENLMKTIELIKRSTLQIAFVVIPFFLMLIFYTSFTIIRVLKRDLNLLFKRCDFWRYYFPLILLNCILLGSLFFIGNVWSETDYVIRILPFISMNLIMWSLLVVNIRKLDLRTERGLLLLFLGLISFFVPQGYYIYKTFNPAIKHFSGFGYQTLSKILPFTWYIMVGIAIFIIWKIWEYLQYESCER